MSSVRLLLAFAETARRGSFANAARELGLTPSAVAKNVMRLEAQLNLRLFHRTTRRVALTHEGAALYERCRRILDDMSDLELLAADASREPSGVLRLDAPVTYGRLMLMPILAALVRQYPALQLDLRLSDRHADIVGEGLDAVVRIGILDDSRLVARAIGAQALGVYGSRAYLERKRRPRSPEELDRHDCIAFRFQHTGRIRPWQFTRDGATVAIDPSAAHVVNDGEGLIAAAAAGLGLVQTPDYMLATAPAGAHLVEVLQRYRPPSLPISLVFPGSRRMPPRLRALIDALTAAGERTHPAAPPVRRRRAPGP